MCSPPDLPIWPRRGYLREPQVIDQIGIALTGVTVIFLTQSKSEKLRRYACLFGIAGQPFWIYSAWTAAQWGVLVLTALYTLAWAKGVHTHWIKPRAAI